MFKNFSGIYKEFLQMNKKTPQGTINTMANAVGYLPFTPPTFTHCFLAINTLSLIKTVICLLEILIIFSVFFLCQGGHVTRF
jgi:hypothetical protein